MNELFRNLEAVEKTRRPKRCKKLFEFWECIGGLQLDDKTCSLIREKILKIYGDLNYEEKDAALQILFKVGNESDCRNLIFDYLGEVFEKYRIQANGLSSYLYVLERIDGDVDESRGPWDLDKTFRAAYEKLKEGHSRYL